MATWILALAVAWPTLLGAAWAQHAVAGPRPWSAIVYLAASRVCHQQPSRSLHVRAAQGPVCGRCTGLYAGGMLTAAWGWRLRRRPRRVPVMVLATAAMPTALTMAAEWSGVPVSNGWRVMAALPTGAVILAATLGAAGAGAREPIG